MAGLWSAIWDNLLLILAVAALLLVNALGVLLTALQLPGTWLMLLATPVVAWAYAGVRWDDTLITWWTPIAMLVLAILGEVIETTASAYGSGRAGGSKRGMALAIGGGVAGAITGAVFLTFIPVIGNLFGALVGAAIGAGLGSMFGDWWAGREWGLVWRAGRGAAVGRFWGAVGKLAVAAVMFLVVAVALVWR